MAQFATLENKDRAVGHLTIGALAVLALLAALGSGTRVYAQACNGRIDISDVILQNPNEIGSVDRLQITLGAGTIGGDAPQTITYTQVKFYPDCDKPTISGLTCDDEGDVIRYQGDSTITSNCAGVTWTSNFPAGSDSAHPVVFTATPAVVVPASNPSYCYIRFDVKKIAAPTDDGTPNGIEELVAYENALCSNALQSSNSQTFQLIFGSFPPPPGRTAPLLALPSLGVLIVLLSAFGIWRLKRVN